MKFLEHKAKEIFARYGIPVPRGIVASKPEEITDPPLPCMVKAQVLVGGRGKAGGIRPAETLEEARQVAGQILGMDIHGYRVKQVYLEERLSIAKELYLGLTIDRSAREPLLMATAMGGMDVEEVPREDLFMEHVPAMIGIQPYILRSLAGALSIERDIAEQVASIARRAYDLFRKEDAELVEINPLIVTGGGRVIAGDAKLVIDDSAEYRHPEYANLDQDRTPLEQEAHDKGIVFIQLDGDIGVIANGAGLTMATLDALALKGGRGGVFLDLGGTDYPAKVKQAFELLIKANLSVLLTKKARVVVQGITGHQGQFHTRAMIDFGTKAVAGVTPGKAGTKVEGVPVFERVRDAVRRRKANASIVFVPAPYAKDAAVEA